VHATSVMQRFNKWPREGLLKAVNRILSYVKTFSKGVIITCTSYLEHSVKQIEDHPTCKYLCSKAEEETLPCPKMKMSVSVNIGHVHDLVAKSTTDPVRLISQGQHALKKGTSRVGWQHSSF
jgi:hypothetical protein